MRNKNDMVGMNPKNRLASLDALRGFDMFWIMGGEELIGALAVAFGFPEFHKTFGHVPWDGLHFMDTVFPTFLFMAGVSFPFSLSNSLAKGLTRRQVAFKSLRRGLTLMVLGIVYWGFLQRLDFDTFRIPSVLGYIGFGWMVASWIYLLVRNAYARVAIALGILGAVTVFFGFVHAPGIPDVAVRFSPEWHLGCWLDRTILGRHSLTPLFDNEGFGGLIPTVATALLGMFAGDVVRHGGLDATTRKAQMLAFSGIVSALLGFALSLFYPIVKNLWSPSFVLVVGGYSFLMFAMFYWLIDVRGCSGWSFFFQVIGVNSITIYLAQPIVGFDGVSRFFLGGVSTLSGPSVGPVIHWIGYISACWLFLFYLYRKKTFLKI